MIQLDFLQNGFLLAEKKKIKIDTMFFSFKLEKIVISTF